MQKDKGKLDVKRFVSDKSKNQYLLISGSGELTKMANEGWIHCMRSA